MNNIVYLSGDFVSPPKKINKHTYGAELAVTRLSGKTDVIPLEIKEDLLQHIQGKETVMLAGKLSSRNQGRRLLHHVYAVAAEELEKDTNEIHLEGYVCQDPVHRVTPLGRHITELFIAVNRVGGTTDYIPCLTWGKTSLWAKDLTPGNKVIIDGRLQSRNYMKKHADGTEELRTVYEVSVFKIRRAIKK